MILSNFRFEILAIRQLCEGLKKTVYKTSITSWNLAFYWFVQKRNEPSMGCYVIWRGYLCKNE